VGPRSLREGQKRKGEAMAVRGKKRGRYSGEKSEGASKNDFLRLKQ